jgi:energy-coupling factor transport system permease protein
MVSGLAEIREAQRIRGHRFRGLRDLIPLFVPLITTALERSLTLAESIEARGFGGVLKGEAMTAEAVTTNLLVGLMALLCGLIWQALRPSAAWVGLVMLACGVALIGLGVHLQGRGVRRTHYRRELWRARDTWVSLACLAAASLATYVRMRDPSALAYYPYPPFSPWPRFTPLLGLAALLSATPAFLWPAPSSRGDRPVAPTVQAGRRA